jgi:hypothetical protein
MATVRFNSSALLEKITQRCEIVLHGTGIEMVNEVKGEFDGEKAFTGKMKQSIRYEVNRQGSKIVLRVGSDPQITPYAPVLEYGRKRNGKMPNLDAITMWVHLKLRAVGKSFYDQLSSQEKGTVFVIARAIAKRGTKGRKVFTKLAKKYRPILYQRVVSAIRNI